MDNNTDPVLPEVISLLFTPEISGILESLISNYNPSDDQSAQYDSIIDVDALISLVSAQTNTKYSDNFKLLLNTIIVEQKKRSYSTNSLCFTIYHGENVSLNIANAINNYCYSSVIPINYTLSTSVKEVNDIIFKYLDNSPDTRQILIFSDGTPLDMIHKDITMSTGIPARSFCSLRFDTICQIIEKVLKYGFSIDMLEGDIEYTRGYDTRHYFSAMIENEVDKQLSQVLHFLDYRRIMPYISNSLNIICSHNYTFSDRTITNYFIQIALMTEALIRNKDVEYPLSKSYINEHRHLMNTIEFSLRQFEKDYEINIPLSCIAMLAEVLMKQ